MSPQALSVEEELLFKTKACEGGVKESGRRKIENWWDKFPDFFKKKNLKRLPNNGFGKSHGH